MFKFWDRSSPEEIEVKHAKAAPIWDEYRESIKGFRAPTPAEIRRYADDFSSLLADTLIADEHALERAQDDVRNTVLAYAAFQIEHTGDEDESGLPPFFAHIKRLETKLKE